MSKCKLIILHKKPIHSLVRVSSVPKPPERNNKGKLRKSEEI
jgi:hypothetical protein